MLKCELQAFILEDLESPFFKSVASASEIIIIDTWYHLHVLLTIVLIIVLVTVINLC